MGKTKAKKPTLKQKELMSEAGLIVKNWLVLKETEDELHLVSKGSGRSRHIKKRHQRKENDEKQNTNNHHDSKPDRIHSRSNKS